MKFCQDYIGQLVLDPLLNSTHHKLRGLEIRILVNTFHINRFKLIFVSILASKSNTQADEQSLSQCTPHWEITQKKLHT